MKTVTIQIGNSDNKLTQPEWCDYCTAVDKAINSRITPHFSGGPPNNLPWQNWAWVIGVPDEFGPLLGFLRIELEKIRKHYRQDSIAWTEGETQFI